MPNAVKLLMAASLAFGAVPALAQDDGADAAQPAETTGDDAPDSGTGADSGSDDAGGDSAPAPATGDLATEAPADSGEVQVGGTYIEQEHGDWQQRCVRTEDGNDPCQLYQLLEDGDGNAVAEISLAPLPEAAEAAAGATVITPLETLLTAQLTMSVDGGEARRYPFSWCSAVGCFSRIGLTDEELGQFRRGAEALIEIRPVAAPDQVVELAVSLIGFTDGLAAVEENNEAATDMDPADMNQPAAQ